MNILYIILEGMAILILISIAILSLDYLYIFIRCKIGYKYPSKWKPGKFSSVYNPLTRAIALDYHIHYLERMIEKLKGDKEFKNLLNDNVTLEDYLK